MHPLTAAEMLDVWDSALSQSPARRPLALLRAAAPDARREELAELSVGARDARLLTVREWFFGPRVTAQAVCPACGERLECAFDLDAVRVDPPEADHTEVGYRLPDSTDLEAIASQTDEASALRLLLRRCLGTDEDVSQEVIDRVTVDMGRRDPQALVEINLTCPACAHHWAAIFDVATFFWTEIHVWAQRMLRDVHALAAAYGWHEADILGMRDSRRQAYLELLGA
jgi:uncharacterized protein (UPF0212 family)